MHKIFEQLRTRLIGGQPPNPRSRLRRVSGAVFRYRRLLGGEEVRTEGLEFTLWTKMFGGSIKEKNTH